MTVPEAKAKSDASAEKKPANASAPADKAVEKKVATNAIADPHKLHADAFSAPVPKPVVAHPATPTAAETKPAQPKIPGDAHPAAPAKPAIPAKPAAASDSNSGLWSWVAGGEKYASDAWNTVKADVGSAVTTVGNAAVSAEKAVASLIPSPVSQPKLDAPPAHKQGNAKPSAAPAAGAHKDAAAHSDATTTTTTTTTSSSSNPSSSSAWQSFQNGASWVMSEASKGLSAMGVSDATEQAVVKAAVALAPSALAVVGGLGMTEMVGVAGLAIAGYQNTFNFGTGTAEANFSHVAKHVGSIKNLEFDRSDLNVTPEAAVRDLKFAVEADKQMGIEYMIPGDGKAGGGASIVKKDGQIIADGKNKDNVEVKATSSLDGQSVQAGDVKVTHTPDHGVVINGAWTITYNGDVVTTENKDAHLTYIFNKKTKERQIVDSVTHQSLTLPQNFSPDGALTELSNGTRLLQTTGSALDAITKKLAAGVATEYFQDPFGNMGAMTSDSTGYKYYAKTHRLEIYKDQHLLRVDFKTGLVQFFNEDPKTGKLVLQPADIAHLPAGWRVLANGSVEVNGSLVAQVGQDVMHIAGATFSRATGKLETKAAAGDPVTVVSTGKTTEMTEGPSGASATKVIVPAAGLGPIIETVRGQTISIDPATGDTEMKKPNGADLIMHGDGSADMKEVSGQTTHADSQGNTTALDAKHQLLFSMKNNGDIHLYDGTDISHTGVVQNISRHIYEPATKSSYESQSSTDAVKAAAEKAESLASLVSVPGGIGASIASLEAALSILDSFGDIPELAEQIGTAKASIECKLAEARAKESLNTELFHAGFDNSTIEDAFAQRGSGTSDSAIADQLTHPGSQAMAMAS